MVFFIHSTFPEEPYANFPVPVIIRKCTAGLFGPCAVPMFYFISGFLFFNGISNTYTLFAIIKRRFRTLFVPFVIAAIFYPSFFVIMEIIPEVSNYINRPSYLKLFKEMSSVDVLNSLFYGASDGWPWAYHLWFMRDLITVVLLSPIIYMIRKWIGYWIIALVLLLYLMFPNYWFIYAMFWFVSGSFFLYYFSKVPIWLVIISLCTFSVLSIYRLYFGEYAYNIFKVLEISAGIVFFWRLYDYLYGRQFCLNIHIPFSVACQFTFFLYLYHEPLFHLLVKATVIIFGANSFGYSMSIIIPPIIIVIIGTLFGRFLKTKLPKFYAVISGGR